MGTPEEIGAGRRLPLQPGVQPHHRHEPGGRRRAHPGHPALSRAGGGRRVLTSRGRATPPGAGARRRGSCRCRGRGRPRSRRAACRKPLLDVVDQRWRTGRRPAGCCPTPPGNRLSPVKTWVPASSGPAPDQRDAARRVPAQVDHLERLVADGHRVAVLDRAADRAPAGRRRRPGARRSRAPVASTTSGSARWWSQCPCVVTTVRTSASPISAQQRLGLGGGVDQQRLAGGRGAQQVGVVRHLAHGQLA